MTDLTHVTEARVTLDAAGRPIQRIVVATTLIVAAAAFTMGVPALVNAGTAAGLGLAAWLAPVVVDGGLTVAGLAAAVRRSQGRLGTVETLLMAGLTLLSMGVQAAHAIEAAGSTFITLLAAAGVATVAPLCVLASTHIALHAVLAEPAKRHRGRAAAAKSATTTRPAAATAPAIPAAAAKPATATRPAAAKTATATRPSAATRPPVPQALAELIPLVRSGELSRRRAATMAGVNRHRVDAALEEAALEETA